MGSSELAARVRIPSVDEMDNGDAADVEQVDSDASVPAVRLLSDGTLDEALGR
jgi:hypothetical protein